MASKENGRSCPDDGTVMEKEIVTGIFTDMCLRCRGAWPDPSELDLIRKAIEDAHAGNFAAGSVIGMSFG